MEQVNYEKLIKIANSRIRYYTQNISKNYLDMTLCPEDIVADTYLKIIDIYGEFSEDKFLELLSKSIKENQKSYGEVQPVTQSIINNIDRLNQWKLENPDKIKYYCKKHSKLLVEKATLWNNQHRDIYLKRLKNYYKNNI